ncbi:MAG: hypothetical protein PW789_14155 [Edaphobacter sp.]|uniref:hypothetical protein n=1 Tax=Edaphobacter sp. TaxID=1934404 RepID=UPI00239B0412|nr:hypothetical protein [Edaphobacter sp.]MDE1177724.1 hypothetical protein [Edaphobacter sp.]
MSAAMQPRSKMVLFNLAVAAALVYQWKMGVPTRTLILSAVVIFPLINVLLFFSAKKSASTK